MRLVTWNINSIRSREQHLREWIRLRKAPEILCLQETKVQDADFPQALFDELGYEVAFHGQKTYNGVAIASRYPMTDVTKGMGNAAVDHEARVIAATIEGMRVVNVYIPNGSVPQSEKYVWKFEFLKAFEQYIATERKTYDKLIVVGDFNIAPEEIDVWDASRFEGHIMFTEAERAWMQKFSATMTDVYRALNGEKREYSWYDYRTNALVGNRGWRIDFICASDALVPHCEACVIDLEPRTWEKPSDHCPVVVKVGEEKK